MQPGNTPYQKFINSQNVGSTVHNCQRHHEKNYFNKSKMCQLIRQQQNVWPTMQRPRPVLHATFVASQGQRSYRHHFQKNEVSHNDDE